MLRGLVERHLHHAEIFLRNEMPFHGRRNSQRPGAGKTGERIHMSDSWCLLGTDYRRTAAAFHYIAKNGEAAADAAVVWADGD